MQILYIFAQKKINQKYKFIIKKKKKNKLKIMLFLGAANQDRGHPFISMCALAHSTVKLISTHH